MLIIRKGYICRKCDDICLETTSGMCSCCWNEIESNLLNFIKTNENNYGFSNSNKLKEIINSKI